MFLLSAMVQPALACGGFFCNTVPIDQGGEDIVFGIDGDTVTVHVQIQYTGEPDDFAWIVPVPEKPEILLSSQKLFDELAYRTTPTWSLQQQELYDCSYERNESYPVPVTTLAGASGSDASTAPNGTGVNVVDSSQIGPYETVTLQANDPDALISWLQDNGYRLPDNLDPVLTPYVTDHSYFVALKLRSDQPTGALQPIALRYPGDGASIPIQLTSIAATPDMRLHVYVVGPHRAVPESYLHVKVNDIVVDWFSGGSNYEDAITVAADEAGGHAFATDFAGDASVMKDVLWSQGRYDIPALAASPDAYTFFNELLYEGFRGDSQLLGLFEQYLPEPQELVGQGVTEQSFYNCLSCYSTYVDQIPFDAPAFAAAIDERIVQPLHDEQQMLDRLPRLTRLTSSVSPVEMTVDPTFVFNGDMAQDVAKDHVARLDILCGYGGSYYDSPRELVLQDGRRYDLPSIQWFYDAGISEYDYLQDVIGNYAIVIEQTADHGQPVVLVDHTREEFQKADAFNAVEIDHAGCGCDQSSGGLASVAGALVLLLRRRRS